MCQPSTHTPRPPSFPVSEPQWLIPRRPSLPQEVIARNAPTNHVHSVILPILNLVIYLSLLNAGVCQYITAPSTTNRHNYTQSVSPVFSNLNLRAGITPFSRRWHTLVKNSNATWSQYAKALNRMFLSLTSDHSPSDPLDFFPLHRGQVKAS